jgi:signal transduction histidine kinase
MGADGTLESPESPESGGSALAAELGSLELLTGLTPDQLTQLASAGTQVLLEPGTEGWTEGGPADLWWLLLEGQLDLARHIGREDVVVGRFTAPGQWAGGFRAWDPNGIYLATGRATAPSRLFRLPATELRRLSDEWFPFGGHLIRGVYGTARTVESTARQRDSLVTLGTLAAGLAHELNNPASAATRAAHALDEECQALLSAIRRLATVHIEAEQFLALESLRQELAPPAGLQDPLELAELEERLGDWLSEHDIDRAWDLAPALAAAGADEAWLERASAVFSGAALAPALEWVGSVVTTRTLLGEVRESTRRVSELVDAVRSYSQMDRGSLQPTDVTEGIENTLVMLGHKLRNGVVVQRDYPVDVPHVEAYPGELNQVWTNLIDNAVDAMDGSGTLTLSTRRDGTGVVVEIADTGPGMPSEVVERAFEAFFTTKEVGKGTGLGLDIARRIVVERHGGAITVDTGSHGTTMRVALPSRPAV